MIRMLLTGLGLLASGEGGVRGARLRWTRYSGA